MRKIKHYWTGFLCLFIFFFSPAQHVPENTARIVAENFINSRLNGVAQKGSTTNLINITSSINAKYTGFYVFKNASDTGFYIISSEYGNHPVLGYSDDTTISSSEQIAPGFLYFLDWYQSV
ncbi:MAG: Spi family protease inhibitor, partial [Flavobacteriaceae bacterium]|nr:Spi family protease inhibitor [Flavobacteriaceae bacterium]